MAVSRQLSAASPHALIRRASQINTAATNQMMQGEEIKQGREGGVDQPAGQLPLTSSGAFGPTLNPPMSDSGVIVGPSPFPLAIKLEWDGAVSLLVLREMTHAALLSEIAQTLGDEAARLAQRRGRLSYVDGQHCRARITEHSKPAAS